MNIDKSWTLFLDRDGIINKKIENDYVRNWEQFEFLPGVIEALKVLGNIFGKIIIVTNQRGIGRGLMTYNDLKEIHNKMLEVFKVNRIKITTIYYCPHDYEKEVCNCRKPRIGMALMAKKDYPEINFSKSIMIGDSLSDIEFAKNVGMIGIAVNNPNLSKKGFIYFGSLNDFAKVLKEKYKKC
ncbi:D-glycero-alpha-D-manno-heptose-1,7-bisphosphate 7-phosphatase [Thermodesulfatator autotrophicus]|uniref:D-glycero-alpha-D-manno-heptose-1,7-bisphosphate 7-phosphatase n=1 Tax=Thermodesulfatator autotrophicus TaxID=1795632 RepID=UPI0018D2EB9F|nr:HAD family hydrolase [Thermodesulfatator autotrophicus]